MRHWFLFPGLVALLGSTVACFLWQRWELELSGSGIMGAWGASVDPEHVYFVLMCLAVAAFPASLIMLGLEYFLGRGRRAMKRASYLICGLCALLAVFGGLIPIRSYDFRFDLLKRWLTNRNEIPQKLVDLRARGEFSEAVQAMEQSLALHEEYGRSFNVVRRPYNHGFSYLFVSLHPGADELPMHLGPGVTEFLFDAWHDGNPGDYTEDKLAKAMAGSSDPLLRTISYWVLRDYELFQKEAFAAARAGDVRLDGMALVAACGVASNREEALEVVAPILDRGVGLGAQRGFSLYDMDSSRIRSFLEGKIGREKLQGYLFEPPGLVRGR